MIIILAKIVVRAALRSGGMLAAYSLAVFGKVSPFSLIAALTDIGAYAAAFALIGLCYDLAFRTNRTPWRYTSTHDVLIILRSATFTSLTFLLAVFIIDRAATLPRSTLLLAWGIDVGLYCCLLLFRRAVHERTLAAALAPIFVRKSFTEGDLALLVGSLDSADIFMRDLSREHRAQFRPVGIVVPTASDVGRELRGVPVLADIAGAEKILTRFAAKEGEKAIIFLDDEIAPADLNSEWIGRIRREGVRFMRRSGLVDSRFALREIDLEELLSRQPVRLDTESIRTLISGRRVLVTGAGGSIGSEICRQVGVLGCAHLSLLDNSEYALFKIDMEIAARFPTLSRSAILCDIRHAERLNGWIAKQQPDIVFHAAALKHVPLVEEHPCEGVLTNVVGTWNVAEAVKVNAVSQFVFISTDKAVAPSSVMGATKRLAESVVRAHNLASGCTRFSVVRFGNVLGSTGSVVPTFRAQIERGGPVTVTHPDVERYFMTIPEAVQLVLHATAKAANTERNTNIYVLDMGKPVKIMQLARRLIELHGRVPDHEIEIQITGLRPGEKLTEQLVDSSEQAALCEPGVLEVRDMVTTQWMDQASLSQLETVARSGAPDRTRDLLFSILRSVRNDSSTTSNLGTTTIP